MVTESSELFDGAEKLNKLHNSSLEEVKLSEDLVGREFELFTFWHVHQSLLGEVVLFLIGLVKVNAALENWDEFLWWEQFFIPENVVTFWLVLSLGVDFTSGHLSEVKNVPFASCDHFGGDFHEETGHFLVGVVVPGDGVDHLDTVHQGWESLFDRVWGTVVQWFNESLKGLKILDIVLGLIQSLGDSEFDTSPL